MTKKYSCPICFASISGMNSKMLTCPYCDALLYVVENTVKVSSEYPWWQKKKYNLKTLLPQTNIVGIIELQSILEMYSIKDEHWYLIFKNKTYIKDREFSRDYKCIEKPNLRIAEKVTHIYGFVPIFTPLHFTTEIDIYSDRLLQLEVHSYTQFKLVQ